jgi:hypothetical protein
MLPDFSVFRLSVSSGPDDLILVIGLFAANGSAVRRLLNFKNYR